MKLKQGEKNMSQYDVSSLYNFLLHTPESGLRKMLVDNKPFTEGHFTLLLKIVKNTSEAAFLEHFEKKDFPKVKMSPNDQKLKDKFWDDCVSTCLSRGLITPVTKAA